MTQKYFSHLNYSLGNEDTSFEYAVVQKYAPEKIVSVCGSGSRAIPLISEKTKELVCVDLSQQQLFLCELRVALIKELEYRDYCKFWGYPPFNINSHERWRKETFAQLNLSADAKEYFEQLFVATDWKSILYEGKWEKTFVFFSKVAKIILGEKTISKLFSFESIEEQRAFLDTAFPRKRWRFILRILGNKALFNALLYKGDFIQKNSTKGYFEYYESAFERLLQKSVARSNFFLQLCFLGEIKYEVGIMFEVKPNIYQQTKKHIKDVSVLYVKENIIEYMKNTERCDFLSLSDVPSYFSGDLEKSFLEDIKTGLSANGVVVLRHYLRNPECSRLGYSDLSSQFEVESSMEDLQMYEIEVLKNESN